MRAGLLALLSAAVAAAALSASAVGTPLHASKTCGNDDILANLSWGQKCLGAGEFCKVGNPEYHAYGFTCPATGRLTYYAKTPPATTTAPATTTPSMTPSTVAVKCASPASVTGSIALGVKTTPTPATAKQAVAIIIASPDTNQEATPFACVVRWAAEWTGTEWWVAGEFKSQWNVPFIVDASIVDGHVYADTGAYGTYLPSHAWVEALAHVWGMHTLYTRLTPAAAIKLAEGSVSLGVGASIRAADAKLGADTSPVNVGWDFVSYVQEADGSRQVVAVTGLGGAPAMEGTYVGGYGFGSQPEAQPDIPLNLLSWVHSIEAERGWN